MQLVRVGGKRRSGKSLRTQMRESEQYNARMLRTKFGNRPIKET
jgi:hypothetical protein